jgi:hypothetical protein
MVKISLNFDVNNNTEVSLETQEIKTTQTEENNEILEEEHHTHQYLNSVINKLDEIENCEDSYLDDFHESPLLYVLEQIQKESLENALILERLIQKEKEVYTREESVETEERENYNINYELESHNVFTFSHFIRIGLCTFWVYFLLLCILVTYKASFVYVV